MFLPAFDVFSLILALFPYKKGSALSGDEEEKVKLFYDHNQLVVRNAENHEVDMLTPPLSYNMDMIYPGIDTNRKTFSKFY